MVRHVTMEQEVAGQILTQPRSALGLQVQRFGRPDHFHVHPVRLGANERILHGSVLSLVPHRHLIHRPRAPGPPDGAAVRMVGMEHFRPAVNQPVFRGITQITPGNRGTGITKGIRTISHGFIFKAEVLMLNVHIVDTERFAPVVQRPGSRPVGIGQRVTLRQEVAVLVHRPERFVTHFMINQHEFPEIRAHAVLNNGLPAARHLRSRPHSQGIQILRTGWFDHEHSEQTHHGQLTVITVTVELPAPFLGVGMDVPFHLHGRGFTILFAFFIGAIGNGIRIRRRRRLTGFADHHARPVDVKTHVLAEFQRVPERDFHAITLVAANHQGLDVLPLDPVLHPTGIMVPFFFARVRVLGFLFPNTLDILRQRVHVAGIVIQPLIQRDFHVDRGNIIMLYRSRGRAFSAARHRHRFDVAVGSQQVVALASAILVHHGHRVVAARVGFGHFFLHLLHQPLMLLFDKRGALGSPLLGILNNGLPFEAFGPGGGLVIHPRGLDHCG